MALTYMVVKAILVEKHMMILSHKVRRRSLSFQQEDLTSRSFCSSSETLAAASSVCFHFKTPVSDGETRICHGVAMVEEARIRVVLSRNEDTVTRLVNCRCEIIGSVLEASDDETSAMICHLRSEASWHNYTG